ncbi:hypothetical protein J2D73_02630 [Acetobacter sacchari]|uniref:ATP-grasp domain-containing protein n=1 Tax=Acetobacter sacchari TaxID=2661687 RepID=A0ABS3LS07_9PROT|nr:hypothetical protein [Acetobacter sacchari]MBO1358693.1 hypothetical protein [Acetobacter sacchari]
MLDFSEFSNDPRVARAHLEECLKEDVPPARQASLRYALWEACLVCGDENTALDHLNIAIAIDPFVRSGEGRADPLRCLLVLAAPGNFQANAPIGMLLDQSTAVHTLWMTGDFSTNASLVRTMSSLTPAPDCLLVGIAEDPRSQQCLSQAEDFARRSGLSVINQPNRVEAVSRSEVSRFLSGLRNVVVPVCRILKEPFDSIVEYPVLIRPISSHAGLNLRKLGCRSELDAYCRHADVSATFFVTDFFDSKNGDGLYRKYRVVFIDGEPFPVHLAVHDDWAVWYYNAHMEHYPDRRAEEARFMGDMASYFPTSVIVALREIATRVGLDYFGLDFGLSLEGQVVIFEVETGMIVHDRDSSEIFPYKPAAIARIRQAFEVMIDRRKRIGRSNVVDSNVSINYK